MQYGGLLAVRNRRVSILNSNPLWGPRRNWAVPAGMLATALIGVVNLYGFGFQNVFLTTPIPSKFWGIPFGFAFGILMMDETRKLIVRSYPKVCSISFIFIFLGEYFPSPLHVFIIVNHREDGLVVFHSQVKKKKDKDKERCKESYLFILLISSVISSSFF
jgi:hypothetical protein